MINLDEVFETAAGKSSEWSHAKTRTTLDEASAVFENSYVDWEEGDEEWGRVLSPDGSVLALLCARLPVGFIVATEPHTELHSECIRWIEVTSMSNPAFKVKPSILENLFERKLSENVDYEHLSALDLWWATV